MKLGKVRLMENRVKYFTKGRINRINVWSRVEALKNQAARCAYE